MGEPLAAHSRVRKKNSRGLRPKNSSPKNYEKFEVFSPVEVNAISKKVIDSRWVLTWKIADGAKKVKARLVAKGFQDPDLTEGLVDTSGCVSLRSSHLQVASLSALKK